MRKFLQRFNPYVLAIAIYGLGLQPALAQDLKGGDDQIPSRVTTRKPSQEALNLQRKLKTLGEGAETQLPRKDALSYLREVTQLDAGSSPLISPEKEGSFLRDDGLYKLFSNFSPALRGLADREWNFLQELDVLAVVNDLFKNMRTYRGASFPIDTIDLQQKTSIRYVLQKWFVALDKHETRGFLMERAPKTFSLVKLYEHRKDSLDDLEDDITSTFKKKASGKLRRFVMPLVAAVVQQCRRQIDQDFVEGVAEEATNIVSDMTLIEAPEALLQELLHPYLAARLSRLPGARYLTGMELSSMAIRAMTKALRLDVSKLQGDPNSDQRYQALLPSTSMSKSNYVKEFTRQLMTEALSSLQNLQRTGELADRVDDPDYLLHQFHKLSEEIGPSAADVRKAKERLELALKGLLKERGLSLRSKSIENSIKFLQALLEQDGLDADSKNVVRANLALFKGKKGLKDAIVKIRAELKIYVREALEKLSKEQGQAIDKLSKDYGQASNKVEFLKNHLNASQKSHVLNYTGLLNRLDQLRAIEEFKPLQACFMHPVDQDETLRPLRKQFVPFMREIVRTIFKAKGEQEALVEKASKKKAEGVNFNYRHPLLSFAGLMEDVAALKSGYLTHHQWALQKDKPNWFERLKAVMPSSRYWLAGGAVLGAFALVYWDPLPKFPAAEAVTADLAGLCDENSIGTGCNFCPPSYNVSCNLCVEDAPSCCFNDWNVANVAGAGNGTMQISTLLPGVDTATGLATGGTLNFPAASLSCVFSENIIGDRQFVDATCGDLLDLNALLLGCTPGSPYPFSFTPAPNGDGAVVVTQELRDDGGTISGTFVADIQNQGDAPVITSPFSLAIPPADVQNNPVTGQDFAEPILPTGAVDVTDPDDGQQDFNDFALVFRNSTNFRVFRGAATLTDGTPLPFDAIAQQFYSYRVQDETGGFSTRWQVCNINPITKAVLGNECTTPALFQGLFPQVQTLADIPVAEGSSVFEKSLPFLAGAVISAFTFIGGKYAYSFLKKYRNSIARYAFEAGVASNLSLQSLDIKKALPYLALMREVRLGLLEQGGINIREWSRLESGLYDPMRQVGSAVATALRQRAETNDAVGSNKCSPFIFIGRSKIIDFTLFREAENRVNPYANAAALIVSNAIELIKNGGPWPYYRTKGLSATCGWCCQRAQKQIRCDLSWEEIQRAVLTSQAARGEVRELPMPPAPAEATLVNGAAGLDLGSVEPRLPAGAGIEMTLLLKEGGQGEV